MTDFTMKPQIDLNSVAALLQKKKIAEAEAAQQQQIQRMNQVTQTIGMASTLASTMVAQSKERQKADFAKAMGEAWAASLPQTKQPMAGPLLPDQARPEVMGPDMAKQNLVRNFSTLNPDKAGELALKHTGITPATDQSLGFQRMTFKGSDGKTKTVNVGVLGTQLVNPVTKQPFGGTPEEVDAMPEYGFVEREEYAGTAEDGTPVYRNPVAGTQYTKDVNGKAVAHTGRILPKLQNPGEAMAGKVQFIAETRANLRDAMSKFDPSYVGLIDKNYKDLSAYLETATDPQAEQFRGLIEEINIMRRHEMFGSALTESERKSFADIALNRNVSAKAFMARLQALSRKLENKEKALEKAAVATGRVLRSAPEKSQNTTGIDLGDGWSAEEVQ